MNTTIRAAIGSAFSSIQAQQAALRHRRNAIAGLSVLVSVEELRDGHSYTVSDFVRLLGSAPTGPEVHGEMAAIEARDRVRENGQTVSA
jgi:hypothetical protein